MGGHPHLGAYPYTTLRVNSDQGLGTKDAAGEAPSNAPHESRNDELHNEEFLTVSWGRKTKSQRRVQLNIALSHPRRCPPSCSFYPPRSPKSVGLWAPRIRKPTLWAENESYRIISHGADSLRDLWEMDDQCECGEELPPRESGLRDKVARTETSL